MAEAAVLIALLQAVTQALTEGALKSLIGFKHHVPDLHNATEDLEKIKGELESIKPILDFVDSLNNDAKKKEVHKNMVVFASQLRKQADKLEDAVDELMNLIHRYNAGGLSGFTHDALAALHFSSDHSTAHRIRKEIEHVYGEIERIMKRYRGYKITNRNVVLVGTSSNGGDGGNVPCLHYRHFDERANLVGIAENENLVLNWLMDGEINVKALSIFGMGGLGKTTFASTIYDHPKVKRHFEFRAWVPISQSWNLSELLMFITNKLKGDKGGNIDFSNESITQSLIRKRYLIVLDDVWDSDILDRFSRSILPNNTYHSRIIITSRTQDLKSHWPTKHLELKPLKDKEAKSLFFKVVFGTSQCPKELVVWGEKFVEKCQGLPIGVVKIGRVLASQSATLREWERMYNSLQWELINNENLKSIQGVLMLSYYKLPNHLKRCFLYCALFPEDYAIKNKLLVRLWSAEGFIEEEGGRTLEEIGERYVDMLIQRSMLQVVKRSETGKPKSCKVHDLMRELALAVAGGENLYVTNGVKGGNKDTFRRLSIKERTGDVSLNNLNFPGLRTLLIFKGNLALAAYMQSCVYPKLNLLRVLNLKGLPIDKIPDIVFNLFNLRFLGLRETKIKEVPSSLEDLYNLQTLDLWKTDVDNLPREVLKLENLRHIFIKELDAHNLKYLNLLKIRGSDAPRNIGALKQLQTLRNIKADNNTLTHLKCMTQLKSLCITQLDRNTGKQFCESISQITGLVRLSIKAAYNSTLVLGNISPPSHLEKLILDGHLPTVPRWFESLHSLTQLYLFGSRLSEGENLITYIQTLRNLVRLALDDAYMGRRLCFPKGSFPSLKTLYLANMNMLVEVVIGKGALAVLSRFHVSSCEHLKEIKGNELLTNVTDLKLKMLPKLHPLKIQNLS